MSNPKRGPRKPATPAELGAMEPLVTAVSTAIAAGSAPTLDIEKPAGTIDATPAAPAEPEPAPEPITKPNGGGSYVRDRVTGHLTLQEA